MALKKGGGCGCLLVCTCKGERIMTKSIVTTIIIFESPVAWPDVEAWAKSLEIELMPFIAGWTAERVNSKSQLERIWIYPHQNTPEMFDCDKLVLWGSFSKEFLQNLVEIGNW